LTGALRAPEGAAVQTWSWFGLAWLWRALRGRSVTFAALFALMVLGASVFGGMREGLRWAGAPWLVAFLLPGLLIALLARKEQQWFPDEARRLWWARVLVFGSVFGAIVLALLMPKPDEPPREPRPAPVIRPIGPRSK
jgi:hypothetical protein